MNLERIIIVIIAYIIYSFNFTVLLRYHPGEKYLIDYLVIGWLSLLFLIVEVLMFAFLCVIALWVIA